MIMVFLFWLAFAIAVGIAASSRGRSGLGWFILAVLISPLLAGIFLAVSPNLKRDAEHRALVRSVVGARPGQRAFVPDGVLAGVPYRAEHSGAVTAMMPGGIVEFRSVDQFRAAVSGESIGTTIPEEVLARYPNEAGDVRYRVEKNGKVFAWTEADGEKVYRNWRSFFDEIHVP